METITFSVQGSAEDPYLVEFHKGDTKLRAYCSCPAGGTGQVCKHRVRILQGNSEGVVGANQEDIKKVVIWLVGSDVEAAMKDLAEAEVRLEQAKKDVSGLKKKLARVLTN